MMREAALTLVVAICVSWACAPTITKKQRASGRIRYDIGVASLNQGDIRGALRELLQAVEFNPELPEAHNALGLTYHSLGRRQLALGHYQRAVELKPSFSAAQNNFGVLLLDLERYDEAVAAFKKALEDILYPTPSLAEGNMGWAYYRSGDLDQGLQHLRNAVAMNPGFCRGYGWLAEIERNRQKGEQLVAYCKRFEKHCLDDAAIAATIPPGFVAEMKYNLGVGYEAIGDRDSARQAFESCASAEKGGEFRSKCARSLSALN